jgi:putative redox protein
MLDEKNTPPTAVVKYQGDLRCGAEHVFSGTEVISDAPLDNNGKAQSFSPTDMVSTSLATCMLTIMGIKARDMNVSLDGTKANVFKTMASDPRRISRVKIDFQMKGGPFTGKEKIILERAARACPVAKSLHPEIVQEIQFEWD